MRMTISAAAFIIAASMFGASAAFAAQAAPQPAAKEFQGPKGPEPTRYGDWENKGIASDF